MRSPRLSLHRWTCDWGGMCGSNPSTQDRKACVSEAELPSSSQALARGQLVRNKLLSCLSHCISGSRIQQLGINSSEYISCPHKANSEK